MQVAFYLVGPGEITQVLDPIPWVRCASGNVYIQPPQWKTHSERQTASEKWEIWVKFYQFLIWRCPSLSCPKNLLYADDSPDQSALLMCALWCFCALCPRTGSCGFSPLCAQCPVTDVTSRQAPALPGSDVLLNNDADVSNLAETRLHLL